MAEVKDYIELKNKKTWDTMYVGDVNVSMPKEFREELNTFIQKYTKMRRPFCQRCVREDWKKFFNQLAQDKQSSVFKGEDYKVTFKKVIAMIGDLERYGARDRFKLLDEVEDIQAVKRNAEFKSEVVANIIQKFQCKIRGEGLQVFVPLGLWEQREGKKWQSAMDMVEEELIQEEGKRKKVK